MYPNNYKRLLIGSIIMGSIIFFSNQLSSYAQELPERTDDSSDETLDITIQSPSFSGQGLEEDDSSITPGGIIEDEEEDNDQGNNDIPFELPFP
jgi:hypothetical protein